MYFRYFVIISPWKRAGPLIWKNLNPLHLRMLCAKFGWNWPSSSGEEDENVKKFTDGQTGRQTDRQTDDGRQKAHLSFQLRWAKNYFKNFVSCILFDDFILHYKYVLIIILHIYFFNQLNKNEFLYPIFFMEYMYLHISLFRIWK